MISLAQAIYGTPELHKRMRKMLVDTMHKSEAINYRSFVEDDITQEKYLELMSREDEWGGEAELFAFVECYGRRVVVHNDSGKYPQPIVYPSEEDSDYDHLITDRGNSWDWMWLQSHEQKKTVRESRLFFHGRLTDGHHSRRPSSLSPKGLNASSPITSNSCAIRRSHDMSYPFDHGQKQAKPR
jgi:hypothetical protein